MTLRNRPFEESMWARVKQHDPRRLMTFWQKVSFFLGSKAGIPFSIIRGVGSLVLIFFLVHNRDLIDHNGSLAITLAGLAGLEAVCLRSIMVWSTAHTQSHYRALWMLPFSPNAIFREFNRDILLCSLWFLLEIAVVYGLVARIYDPSLFMWVGVVSCTILQWVLCLCLTCIVTAWPLATIFGVIGLFALFFNAPTQLLWISRWINPINPVSWTNTLFFEGCLQRKPTAILWLFPILALMGVSFYAFRRFKQLHNRGELLRVPSQQKWAQTGGMNQPPASTPALSAWYSTVQWERLGLIERLISKILSPRERIVAEMLAQRPFDWTARFWPVVVYIILFLLASLLVDQHGLDDLTLSVVKDKRLVFPLFFPWGVCVFFSAVIAARLIHLLMWFSFQSYHLFPVNAWGCTKIIAKTNAVLVLLFVPPFLVLSFSPAWLTVVHTTQATTFGPMKFLILVWCLGIAVLSFNLSAIPWKWRFRLPLLAKFVVLAIFYVLLCVGLAAPTPWDWVATAAFPFLVTGWLFVCGSLIRSGSIFMNKRLTYTSIGAVCIPPL